MCVQVSKEVHKSVRVHLKRSWREVGVHTALWFHFKLKMSSATVYYNFITRFCVWEYHEWGGGSVRQCSVRQFTMVSVRLQNHHHNSTLMAVSLQDPKLATELESRGTGSLEQRVVTICSGLDFVNVTYNHFVARDEETANVRATLYWL